MFRNLKETPEITEEKIAIGDFVQKLMESAKENPPKVADIVLKLEEIILAAYVRGMNDGRSGRIRDQEKVKPEFISYI